MNLIFFSQKEQMENSSLTQPHFLDVIKGMMSKDRVFIQDIMMKGGNKAYLRGSYLEERKFFYEKAGFKCFIEQDVTGSNLLVVSWKEIIEKTEFS